MKLILGLGNPEDQYRATRHNLGFMMLDQVAQQLGAAWRHEARFKADLAQATLAHHKLLLAKPTTYYNLSGEAARALVNFYKLAPADVLVIHDELALPFGMLRTRLSGSDAGNNGIKSLIAHLGPDFARLRVGIANELAGRQPAADFVLSRLTASEQAQVPELARHAQAFIQDFAQAEPGLVPTSLKLPPPDTSPQ